MLTPNTQIDELVTKMRERTALAKRGIKTSHGMIRKTLFTAYGESNGNGAVALTDVEELMLDTRGRRALRRLGVKTVGQLLALHLDDLDTPYGCGPVTLHRLRMTQETLRRRVEALGTNGSSMEAVPTSVDLSANLAWLQERDQIRGDRP